MHANPRKTTSIRPLGKVDISGIRAAILDGAGLSTMWDEIWALLLIGVVSAPIGLFIFRRGEIYAKKHGKLKRSG